ncbi:MAG TPA: pyrroline-5-carboxylate reductase dimerization domain-containing protein, partial [bacterium]|nr:pyrroline-5-carboxylate reductase dimerization domain-containing protein [bacterium]
SVTALAPGRSATDAHLHVAEELFRAVGEVLTVPEETMDVVTGLSGSGPAYVYRFIEALIAAGTELGLTEELAKQLAVHTLVGAARMLSEPNADSVELRRRVTSPGGTTQAGLTALEERGFASAVKEAVRRAAERAAELSQEHSKKA